LFLHYGYFDLWTYVYGQCMYVMTFVLLGPNICARTVTLGLVMQVIDAFSHVHSSFSFFIYNWTTVTELRSIRKRLHEFEVNLAKHSRPGHSHPGLPAVPAAFVLSTNTSAGSDRPGGGVGRAIEQ
jgi:ABC-type long-subunit fatty acid transport system fused permease/ATPase subunit